MASLLTPLSFAGLRLRNRIVMPPMWSGQATPEGFVTDVIIDYHRKRAAGGCGLVIVEHTFVHPSGRHTPTQLGIVSDAHVDGLARLAAAVRGEGAVVALQITHAGSRARSAILGRKPFAPSALRHPNEPNGEVPEELTVGQIAGIVRAFGDGAVRARAAGFDAIEIHAAHGFLLSEFLSPLTNQRTDEYGGTLENRGRLHLEVLSEIRHRLGPAVPVFVRLGAADEMPGGLEVSESSRVAQWLEGRGADMIDVSGGLQGARGSGGETGYFVPYAAAIKAVVHVPVMVTGGIREAALADRVVRGGQADLIGIGRAMLEEPDWAARAAATLGGGAALA